MHFNMKSYLKNTHNYTAKQARTSTNFCNEPATGFIAHGQPENI
jgi:hypothetical protein